MNFNEISSGITHIEDLPIKEFLSFVTNIAQYESTEKLDGSQILFGIDDIGFYTSRESKGGRRVYQESDYKFDFPTTYMRSAHKLLESVIPILKSAGMRCGDQVEAEVLYGEVPNVVPYSGDTNYLIFLRTTAGSVNIDNLNRALSETKQTISVTRPATSDGISIKLVEEFNTWAFSRSPKLPLDNKKIEKFLEKYIKKLTAYLNTGSGILGRANSVIESVPLNRIPEWCDPKDWKFYKNEIKTSKTEIRNTILSEYIAPIKEILLDECVRGRGSKFGPPVEQGGWIEGIVFKNAKTGHTVKLIDKSTFGTIREDSWRKRNYLTESARSPNSVSGFFGTLLVEMASAIGHSEIGTIQAKSYIQRNQISSGDLSYLTENLNFSQIKPFWLTLLETKQDILHQDLDDYKSGTKLDTNIQRAVYTRTLETYASINEKINNFIKEVRLSQTSEDLVKVLINKHLSES